MLYHKAEFPWESSVTPCYKVIYIFYCIGHQELFFVYSQL